MCSNTRIATIYNAGNIKATSKANGYVAITHKVQAPKPTVGMQAKPVYKQTIASSYTKYKDTKLLQATKATKVSATTSTGKSLITITDAQVKAKDESGFVTVFVTRKSKLQTKHYLLHITVVKNTVEVQAIASTKLSVHKGAEDSHSTANIAKNNKLIITGYASKFYIIGKGSKIKYVKENKATQDIDKLKFTKPTTAPQYITDIWGYINKTTKARSGVGKVKDHPELYYIYKNTAVKITGADKAKKPKHFFISPQSDDKVIKGHKGFVKESEVAYITAKAVLAVVRGGSTSLSAKLNNDTKAISYSSTNTLVASIVGNKVEGISVGAATITMTANNNRAKSTCLVSVYSKIDEQGFVSSSNGAKLYSGANKEYKTKITLSKNTKVNVIGKCGEYYYISYKEGSKTKYAWVKIGNAIYIKMPDAKSIYHYHAGKIKAELSSGATSTMTFSWSNAKGYIKQTKTSGNTVTFEGLRATKKSSPAILYASYTVEGVAITSTCKVTVEEIEVEVIPGSLTMSPTQTHRLSVSVTPKTLGEYNWSSSDESIATVDKYGVVRALDWGNCIITLSFRDVKCTINVKVRHDYQANRKGMAGRTYAYMLVNSTAVGIQGVVGFGHMSIAITVDGYIRLYSFQGAELKLNGPGTVAVLHQKLITFDDAWDNRFDNDGVLQKRLDKPDDDAWGEHYDKYIRLEIIYTHRDDMFKQAETFRGNPPRYLLERFNCADFVLRVLSAGNVAPYDKEFKPIVENKFRHPKFPTIPNSVFNDTVWAVVVEGFKKPDAFVGYPLFK